MVSEKILKNVPGLEPEQEVVIKKLGYGSLTKLRNKCTNASMGGNGAVKAQMMFGEYSKWLVIYGIKSAPFFEKCRSSDDKSLVIDKDLITPATGDYIFKEIQVFNKFDEVESLKKE